MSKRDSLERYVSPVIFLLMSSSDINLDGGEISVLKALGLGGGGITGEDLAKRVQDLEPAELIDTLKGLIAMGYVDADKDAFYSLEEMGAIHFMVNSGYSKDLKDAIDPKPQAPKSRRVRRE
jgi:hypothetical protein